MRLMDNNNISVCCLQEVEIPVNFPETTLNCNGYLLELESSKIKKRTGIYLRKDIKHVRRNDLEKDDFHILIVDVKL